MKKCGKCQCILKINEFHNNENRYDGKSGWCKNCMRPALKKQKNKDIKKQRAKKMQDSITNFISLPNELWKDIPNYEGIYQISNLGRLRNISSYWRLLSTPINKQIGYRYCSLTKNKKSITKYIHRLVAEAFIPNPNNYKVINYIDGIKDNCIFSNLEWSS